VLVEEGVISKAKAIEAIEGVAELTREIDEVGPPDRGNQVAAQLAQAIAKSFALKDQP
jgi:hypothetical protein